MLLDTWMPDYDAGSKHTVTIRADPGAVHAVLLQARLDGHPVVAGLLALRAFPGWFLSRGRGADCAPSRTSGPGEPFRLQTLLGDAFVVLAHEPPTEIVLGLTGRFWRPTGGLISTDAAGFRDPVPPGFARAAWNFRVDPSGHGGTTLRTETRVRCGDPAARRSFLRYWRLIAPLSGLIRRLILKQVKREAEDRRE